jgi:hypothetical protein
MDPAEGVGHTISPVLRQTGTASASSEFIPDLHHQPGIREGSQALDDNTSTAIGPANTGPLAPSMAEFPAGPAESANGFGATNGRTLGMEPSISHDASLWPMNGQAKSEICQQQVVYSPRSDPHPTFHLLAFTCLVQGCKWPAATGGAFCEAHIAGNPRRGAKRKAGNKVCTHPECSKNARGPSEKCFAHGGGRRCSVEGCEKSSQGAGTRCFSHVSAARSLVLIF